MAFDEPAQKKRSLGALRKNEKTKDRSPDLTGVLTLQRHTIEVFVKQFKESDAAEVACCIAGWRNTDSNGQPYLTIEISPRYVSRRYEPTNSNLEDFI